MIPVSRMMIAQTCKEMYQEASLAAQRGGPSKSETWLRALTRTIGERLDEFVGYDIATGAIEWNFAEMLWLIKWTWQSLLPKFDYPPMTGLAPWNKSVKHLSQSELKDSLRAIEVRWRTLLPSPELWSWIDALDHRIGELCVRGNGDIDEDFIERDGVKIASDTFIADMTSILADMARGRAVHESIRRRNPVLRAPKYLPVTKAREWLLIERTKLTVEANDLLDVELAEFNIRPGEISRYARARLGVVPRDIRVPILYCRPILSDYKRDRHCEFYLVFDRICRRHSFNWAEMALLTERTYFALTESGERCCDVMESLREPTIVRVLGGDYLVTRNRVWRCESPEQAICLWILRASEHYKTDNQAWDLKFLKTLYRSWTEEALPPIPKILICHQPE